MNLELFIARRLLKGDKTGAVAVPIVKIALAGIVLGVCVMLLSVFIITGFKNEITAKLSGFMAHFTITAYENNDSYSGNEIERSDSLIRVVRDFPHVKQVYAYVDRPAILKSKEEIHGVVLKGMDSLFQADFYKKHLKEGEYPDFGLARPSNDILLSSSVAALLNLKLGDKVTAHFVQEPPRTRVFIVKGIYDTGFKEYDDMLIVCDMRHLQKLNGWTEQQVSGLAVELDDMRHILDVETEMDNHLFMRNDNDFYKITTLREAAPQVFDWLNLLNMNVWIILTLIVLVAGFNMVSGLLILILEKTSFIGILKALGYWNVKLRKLFLYIAIGLIGRGMIAGNVLAFLLGGIQAGFRIVRLDPTTYYMDTVPIYFDWWYIILLNIGILLVSVLMLILPTMLISKIRPIKAIRFE